MDPVITADDDAFVRAFHHGEIANSGFHHRDHLRLAWVQTRRLGAERAGQAVTDGIRKFATHHGSPDRYNETMTRFWLRAVDMAIRLHPELPFEELLAAEPHLLDKRLPFQHWSSEEINSPSAKAVWTEPDLRPMPAI
jgi:hypothetical protein